MRNYSVKESKIVNGKKTTITINTEDPELVRSLLNAPKEHKSKKDNKAKAKIKI